MGASLPTQLKACFNAMEKTQFTFNRMLSLGKVILAMLWDSWGVLLSNLQKHGENMNSASYCEVLLKFRDTIRRERPGQLARGVLLQYDNARPHSARTTQERIQEMQWGLLEHPPYSPDLAPSDSHLFDPLKNHLSCKGFADDEEVQKEVQKWLDESEKTSMQQVLTIDIAMGQVCWCWWRICRETNNFSRL
jgi:histone-lysine N-methyltransferase SETMAR